MEVFNMSIVYEPAGRAREYAALAANLYSGCGHGCKYCYAPGALRRDSGQFHNSPQPRAKILALLKNDCQKLSSKNTPPVLFSFTTDPYQPLDEAYQLTRYGIQILHDNGLNVEILTKGGMRAARDFDLLTPKDAFATTLTFIDTEQSREWEPVAALPADRMEAMRLAHSKGIRVWASLEPVIDPEQSLELIRKTHTFVDLFKVGVLNHHPYANKINWHDFGWKAKKLLESLGKPYYLKHDLRQQMKIAI
jgi:DNA repair photolyase